LIGQRQKQNLISRLTGASDVGQDDQRIGCTVCGFPGHSARQCFNLVRVKKTKHGNTTARLLELSSTSSEDDDEDLIKDLTRKREIMSKIASEQALTKEEIAFLKKQELKELKGKKSKKLSKRKKKNAASSSSSSSSSGSSSDSSSEEESRKSKRKSKKGSVKKAGPEKPGSSGKKNCEVCLIEKCKYRCPKCRILYCAVNNDFVCYRDHKEKGICDDRIDKGLHIKPKSKEDEMGIKEKLAMALKRRRKIRKAVRNPNDEQRW